MFNYLTDELVWAIRREREEEARSVLPHTAGKPDPERSTHEHDNHRAEGIWVAPTLRAGARP
jgi:hypothetical protein